MQHWGSVVAAHSLSCPEERPILVPRPRINPASRALEGGFSTTEPLGGSPLPGCLELRLKVFPVCGLELEHGLFQVSSLPVLGWNLHLQQSWICSSLTTDLETFHFPQLCESIPYNKSLYQYLIGSISLKSSNTYPACFCSILT